MPINCADGAGNFVAGGTATGNAYRSTDAGAIWSQIALGAFGSDTSALDCDEFGNVIAGFSNGAVAYSDNSGVSWSALTSYLNSGAASGQVRAITAGRGSGGRWMAGFEDGFGAISPPL